MRRTFFLVALLALVTAGCQQTRKEPPNVGGVRREKRITKIVSLSPGTSEIVGQGASYTLLKGRTQACNYPQLLFRMNIPVVAGVKPDYEKIAMIKPELVVYDADLYGEQDVAKIKQLGADTFAVGARTVEAFEKELYRLGSAIGYETSISSYVDKIEDAAKGASSEPLSPTPKVVVIMPGKVGEHMAAGVGSFQADVVKCAGGQPVGPSGEKFASVSAEQLLALNPDVIVTAGDPTPLLADPRLKTMSAITRKKFVALDQDVLLRRGFRLDKLLLALHTALAEQVRRG